VAAKKKVLKTVLIFVQDETGSMMGIEQPTRSAFNEYFKTLKNDPQIGEVETQIWQFSDVAGSEERVRPFFAGALAKVPKLTTKNYRPRGVTPLLDAVGTAIKQTEAIEADRYLFVVQTDGMENASRDFTREQIAKLVKKKEKSPNWTLVFLGAGVAEWTKEAGRMGARAASSVSYDSADQAVAYASLSRATGQFLRTNSVKGSVAADTQAEIKKRKRTPPKA
jgi:hypothetical protein